MRTIEIMFPVKWGILQIISLILIKEGLSQCLPGSRPNFLICITDDQSWAHTSNTGDPVVRTPHFDRIAREGILFTEAYCAASSCTPSRSAILTGRNIYELEEGSILASFLPEKFNTYQDILENSGYLVGYTGKGTKPGFHSLGGRSRDPAGPEYNQFLYNNNPAEINPINYPKNFEQFLKLRQEGQPFSFWMGAYEPHRPYKHGIGLANGLDSSKVIIPDFLPDVSVKGKVELTDYLYEIQYFDAQLGEMLRILEEKGELDNTIIVVTSDNGMPFPRAKTELYEYGVHVPLAIRWGNGAIGGRKSRDFISLKDIAPTFLDAAGEEIPSEMSARSFLGILQDSQSGQTDPQRDHCFVAHERHGSDKRPRRGIYTDQFIYIYNYPCCLDWPSSPDSLWNLATYDLLKDGLPYSSLLWKYRHHPKINYFWNLYRGPRKQHELYNRLNDPFQLHNLAYDPAYLYLTDSLFRMINLYGRQTGDPRAFDPDITVFDTYTYFSSTWINENQILVTQDKKVMRSLGIGKQPGDPIPAPVDAADSLRFDEIGFFPPDYLKATISWRQPIHGKDIIRYLIYFFNRDLQPLGPPVGEVCAGTHSFSLPELLSKPEEARYLGVVSANDGGEYYTSESLIELPSLLGRQVFPQPTSGPFSLNISSVPGTKISWEIIDSQGRKITSDYLICTGSSCLLKDDLSFVSPGVYYLRITLPKGLETHRIVKI